MSQFISAAMQSQIKRHNNLKLGKAKGIKRPRTNINGLASLIDLFLTGMTTSEAAAESGLSIKVTERFVKSLRDHSPRLLIITGWILRSRRYVPIYTLTQGGEDKPKPPKLTSAERKARWRARKNNLAMIHMTAGTYKENTNVFDN